MKEKFFFEGLLPNEKEDCKFGIKIKKTLFSGRSNYQKIKVIDTYYLGKVLVLDEIIQLSEKYEFIYHELLANLSLFSHPNPKKVAIIGGGDGGVLREVLKHRYLKKVYLVELDKKVFEISIKYFPSLKLKKSLKDKRTEVVFEDGSKFIEKFRNFFDLIIVDSTDPLKFSLSLFQKKFFKKSYSALKNKGIFSIQTGDLIEDISGIKKIKKNLEKIFDFFKIYHFFSPDYFSCDYSISLASKKINLEKIKIKAIKRKLKKIKDLKYYSLDTHIASGVLPEYLKQKLSIN